MTATRAILLNCDHRVNGGTCHQSMVVFAKDSGPARHLAHQSGWRRHGKQDLCPIHAREV